MCSQTGVAGTTQDESPSNIDWRIPNDEFRTRPRTGAGDAGTSSFDIRSSMFDLELSVLAKGPQVSLDTDLPLLKYSKRSNVWTSTPQTPNPHS